jgi:hypothetical protein
MPLQIELCLLEYSDVVAFCIGSRICRSIARSFLMAIKGAGRVPPQHERQTHGMHATRNTQHAASTPGLTALLAEH